MIKKIFKFSFLFLLVLVFTTPIYAEDDTTPPTIISSYPEDSSTDVPINLEPTIIFSEALDQSTITSSNIQLRVYAEKASDSTKISAALTYTENNTVSFLLDSELDYNKQYYFFVGSGVKDLVGNSLVDTWYHIDRENHKFTTKNLVTLSSITITTPATKLNYTVGDILDIGGLVVTGTYNDESTKVETITTADITGFDNTIPVTGQILTITIGEKIATYTININAVATNTPDPISINLKIYAGDTVLFNGPKTVTACAESPAINAPITVNGKCAIEQSGLSNTWTWNYAPSGWLDELGGYTTTPDFSKFWGYFTNLNYGHGNDALNQYHPSVNDELLLTYNSYPLRISTLKISGIVGDTITFTAEEESTFDANYNMLWTPSSGATITLGTQSCTTIADGTCSIILNTAGSLNAIGSKTSYVPSTNLSITVSLPSSGGGGGRHTPPTFDVQKALAYLKSVQGADGSFGDSSLYTDWAGIAFGALNVADSSKDKILNYFNSHNILSSLLTDNERHAIALLALGQNPYSFNGVNYIDPIVKSFDGEQFGEADLINDDIFALIPLKNSGYAAKDDLIIKDIAFLISKQKVNGSWEESVDITAVAIQALKSFESIQGVNDALQKAVDYLIGEQKSDGGWGNMSSTSWAMQAMSALDASWIKNGHTPIDYLALQQTTDGAVSPLAETLQNRIWATSYAIAASSQKPWSVIMQTVSKPVIETIPNSLTNLENPSTRTKTKSTPKIIPVLEDLSTNTETLSEITPETLTGAVINTSTTTSSNTIPIISGTLSGIFLLYLLKKILLDSWRCVLNKVRMYFADNPDAD